MQNRTSTQCAALRGFFFVLLIAALLVAGLVSTANAQSAPPPTTELTATDKQVLVEVAPICATWERNWSMLYEYTSSGIAFREGKADGFTVGGTILRESEATRTEIVAELRAYATSLRALPGFNAARNGKATALETFAYFIERYRPGFNF